MGVFAGKIVCDGSIARGVVCLRTQMVSFTLSQGDWKWFSFTVPAAQLKSMVGVDWNVRQRAPARTSSRCPGFRQLAGRWRSSYGGVG